MRALSALICLMMLLVQPAGAAEERQTLGFGRIFSNDALGDGRDRWRTGSYSVGWVRGPGWSGTLPERFGEIVEYRFRAEIIAPASLRAPSPLDRRYVGALSFGAHSHFRRGSTAFSLGADLVGVGPQTGLGSFQKAVHELLGGTPPTVALAGQIPNSLHPTVSFSATREWQVREGVQLRPFVEAQAGVETFLRFGADITLGRVFSGDLVLRDVVTGQRHAAVTGPEHGLGAVLGGDVAWVTNSAYLPSGGLVQLEQTRSRLRAGVLWRGGKSSVFYGLTWLGKEFQTQPSAGQLLGSLSLRIRF